MVTVTVLVIAVIVGVAVLVRHRRWKSALEIQDNVDPPADPPDHIYHPPTDISVSRPQLDPHTLPHTSIDSELPQYEVTLVYSHLTPEKDEQVILAFTSFAEYGGIKVNRYEPSVVQDGESKWLEQSCKTSSCILCVVNEYFQREWRGEEIPSIAVVSPLEKIFHAYIKRRDCPRFVVILPSKSDKRYIPSDYLDRVYDMTDTDEIVRFIQRTPKYDIPV